MPGESSLGTLGEETFSGFSNIGGVGICHSNSVFGGICRLASLGDSQDRRIFQGSG